MRYSAYAHSVMVYGIALWGNAVNSKNVFIIQKRIIRNIMSANPRDLCRGLLNI
jgi:hypothetical protein